MLTYHARDAHNDAIKHETIIHYLTEVYDNVRAAAKKGLSYTAVRLPNSGISDTIFKELTRQEYTYTCMPTTADDKRDLIDVIIQW